MSEDDAMSGWHEDPLRRHQHRYWDGSSWTDHVADDGQQSVDPMQGKQQTPVLRNKKLEPSLEAGEELLSVSGFFTGPRAIKIMSEIPGFFVIPVIPMLTMKYWVVGITQKRTVVFVCVMGMGNNIGFRVRVEDVTLVDKRMTVIMPETNRPRGFWFHGSSKKSRAAFTQAVARLQNADTSGLGGVASGTS